MFASHFDGTECSGHSPSTMSDEHKRQVEYVVRAADAAGYAVETEVSLGTGVRSDVVVRGSYDVAVEVQRSSLTKRHALTRTAKTIEAGLVTAAWISDRDYPERRPGWFWHVPSVGMNKQLWDVLPPQRAATALGLREVFERRCVWPDVEVCMITEGRPCGGWHPDHRPWTGMTVDDVTEMAPERGIVPINWFDKWSLLVSPESRTLYERLSGRSSEWRPAVRPPKSRRTKLRDCPRPADDPPDSPAPLSDTGDLVKMPKPPQRVRVQPNVCGVPAVPGAQLICGAPAQLYPGGWRCVSHAPGRRT